jgi:hypothetical protein
MWEFAVVSWECKYACLPREESMARKPQPMNSAPLVIPPMVQSASIGHSSSLMVHVLGIEQPCVMSVN